MPPLGEASAESLAGTELRENRPRLEPASIRTLKQELHEARMRYKTQSAVATEAGRLNKLAIHNKFQNDDVAVIIGITTNDVAMLWKKHGNMENIARVEMWDASGKALYWQESWNKSGGDGRAVDWESIYRFAINPQDSNHATLTNINTATEQALYITDPRALEKKTVVEAERRTAAAAARLRQHEHDAAVAVIWKRRAHKAAVAAAEMTALAEDKCRVAQVARNVASRKANCALLEREHNKRVLVEKQEESRAAITAATKAQTNANATAQAEAAWRAWYQGEHRINQTMDERSRICKETAYDAREAAVAAEQSARAKAEIFGAEQAAGLERAQAYAARKLHKINKLRAQTEAEAIRAAEATRLQIGVQHKRATICAEQNAARQQKAQDEATSATKARHQANWVPEEEDLYLKAEMMEAAVTVAQEASRTARMQALANAATQHQRTKEAAHAARTLATARLIQQRLASEKAAAFHARRQATFEAKRRARQQGIRWNLGARKI